MNKTTTKKSIAFGATVLTLGALGVAGGMSSYGNCYSHQEKNIVDNTSFSKNAKIENRQNELLNLPSPMIKNQRIFSDRKDVFLPEMFVKGINGQGTVAGIKVGHFTPGTQMRRPATIVSFRFSVLSPNDLIPKKLEENKIPTNLKNGDTIWMYYKFLLGKNSPKDSWLDMTTEQYVVSDLLSGTEMAKQLGILTPHELFPNGTNPVIKTVNRPYEEHTNWTDEVIYNVTTDPEEKTSFNGTFLTKNTNTSVNIKTLETELNKNISAIKNLEETVDVKKGTKLTDKEVKHISGVKKKGKAVSKDKKDKNNIIWISLGTIFGVGLVGLAALLIFKFKNQKIH